MVRKLLKRKLKIANLKKLKTIGYRFTSLSQWAIKQLSKKQNTYLCVPYAKNLILKKRLHRKQLLSQLVGGFSFSQSHVDRLKIQSHATAEAKLASSINAPGHLLKTKENKAFEKITNQLTNLSKVDLAHSPLWLTANQRFKNAQPTFSLLPKDSKPCLGDSRSADSLDHTKPVLSPSVFLGDNNRRLIAKYRESKELSVPSLEANNQSFYNAKQNKWPLYSLRWKTAHNQAKICTSNWKSIYSLDQLMCHQYDAQKQFARRSSRLKSSLREKQKLTALYGRITKKQWQKLSQKNNISHKSYNMASFLESRLDVALKRCFVFNTLRNAQHWINQGRILVNHKVITSSSYILRPGDVMSIGEVHKNRYKSQFLNLFYKIPKEGKYIQSGKLLSRWREWAALYNVLRSHYCKALQTEKHLSAISLGKSRDHKQVLDKMHIPWPDLAIQNFWYSSGRSIFRCLYKDCYAASRSLMGVDPASMDHKPGQPYLSSVKTLGARNLVRWLRKKRWPITSYAQKRRATSTYRRKLRPCFTHWKDIYRRRILLFSRWLLSANPLTSDGLYFLRWHRGFIRKKSIWIRAGHRQCTLQKGLQFEVSYKKLCAIYLYPAQRIVLPCLIDFRLI